VHIDPKSNQSSLSAYLLRAPLGESERQQKPARIGAMSPVLIARAQPMDGSTEGIANSLFHEPWWLSAATAGRYEEVVVEQGGKIVGRLPYLPTQRGPFRLSRMPPFTHLLGPLIEAGAGKPQTRLTRRLSITRALIDKLPPFIHFEQQFDPTMDDGLAIADGLAFQDRGFGVAQRYTFEIDCRKELQCLWDAMHFKTRQHIRRAEEKYTAQAIDDPAIFAQVYLSNIKALGKTSWIEFESFPALFAECRSRKCGQILAACGQDGVPVSMVFLVWTRTTMYYLLSTRRHDPADNGSINMLLWSAVKFGHERGLIFDLDGVYSSGAARFLSGFGGQLKTRLIVSRSGSVYGTWRFLKQIHSKSESQHHA
jgi:Acetyltransferase (GNAT) domain